jgi:hypothetical protein
MAKRICSHCDLVMMEGYCIEDGLENYCSDKCLEENMTREQFEALYAEGEGSSYYTDWYEVEDEDEEEDPKSKKDKALELAYGMAWDYLQWMSDNFHGYEDEKIQELEQQLKEIEVLMGVEK